MCAGIFMSDRMLLQRVTSAAGKHFVRHQHRQLVLTVLGTVRPLELDPVTNLHRGNVDPNSCGRQALCDACRASCRRMPPQPAAATAAVAQSKRCSATHARQNPPRNLLADWH